MKDEKALVPSSVIYEEHKVCVGQPVILGKEGVLEVKSLAMTEEERATFEKACLALRDNLSKVGY